MTRQLARLACLLVYVAFGGRTLLDSGEYSTTLVTHGLKIDSRDALTSLQSNPQTASETLQVRVAGEILPRPLKCLQAGCDLRGLICADFLSETVKGPFF